MLLIFTPQFITHIEMSYVNVNTKKYVNNSNPTLTFDRDKRSDPVKHNRESILYIPTAYNKIDLLLTYIA